MTWVVRIFETEEEANSASENLLKVRLTEQRTLAASALAGQEQAAVEAAVSEGLLPGGHAAIALGHLREGRTLIALNAPYGRARQAIDIMERSGAVHSETLTPYVTDSPALFSDLAGIPTLTSAKASNSLASHSFSLSSMFGLPLLSRGAAPFSSLFGLKTVSTGKSKNSSFGLPLLSRNPAPLSSMFGLKTVMATKRPSNWGAGGMPMLSDNPAPLSSTFGIPTLTKNQ